ncbi:MAG TPA: aldehyde dehydrogenase family protein [Candidatus Nanopelagicales bacterium]|nr:aldehyde dehydrogenase family protein [Candidatus Nanopelagicales bacterium]
MTARIVRENPAHPVQQVGSVAASTPTEVDAVVRAADAAQRPWSQVPLRQRCERVRAAADRLTEPLVATAADLLAREMGKPLRDAAGEVGFAAVWLRWCAENAPRVLREHEIDDAAGRLLTRRLPFGVVAAVTPWNAPIILSMLKVGPALVAGNAIVVKPSPYAPLAVTAVLEALAQQLPDGLLQVVHGDAEAGEALVGHRLVRKVAFTGGEVVARAIAATAARQVVPTVMELGGNDAALFLDDAVLDGAAFDRIVVASFATSGQVCMASKRLYVQRGRLDDFVAGFEAAALRNAVVGDPLTPGISVGPVVTRASQQRLGNLVADARERGAEVREVGAVDPSMDEDGYFVRPRIVLGLPDDAPLVSEEQFGPIVPVMAYDDLEEGLARANAGDLGLGASVWSADEERAFEVARRLEAGFVFVNTHNRTGMSLRAPFGGVKKSGFGREYGDEGLLEYAQTAVVHAPAAFRPGADPAVTAAASRAYPGQR